MPIIKQICVYNYHFISHNLQPAKAASHGHVVCLFTAQLSSVPNYTTAATTITTTTTTTTTTITNITATTRINNNAPALQKGNAERHDHIRSVLQRFTLS